MPPQKVADFYSLQRRQWRLSLLLTGVLFLFYVTVIGLAVLFISAGLRMFRGAVPLFSGPVLIRSLIIAVVLALGLALFHYFDSRRSGAGFILRRLGARLPDLQDRYHKQFIDTLEEIRIASGLPRVQGYILPTLAINCLALIKADKTPVVAVTEGLLSETDRKSVV